MTIRSFSLEDPDEPGINLLEVELIGDDLIMFSVVTQMDRKEIVVLTVPYLEFIKCVTMLNPYAIEEANK